MSERGKLGSVYKFDKSNRHLQEFRSSASSLWSVTVVMTIDKMLPSGNRRRGLASVPLENRENAGGWTLTVTDAQLAGCQKTPSGMHLWSQNKF